MGIEGKSPVEPDATPAIEKEVFDYLRETLGEEDFAEVISAYVESTAGNINGMLKSFASADSKTLERLAHSTKSASANVGAMILSTMAKELETRLREGEMAGARERIHSLQVEFERVRGELI